MGWWGGVGGGSTTRRAKGMTKEWWWDFANLPFFSAFILNRGEDRTPYSESFLDIRTFSGSEELSGKRKR